MALMGLIDSGSEDAGAAKIDPKTQKLIRESFDRSTASDPEIAKQLNEGVAAAGGLTGLSADQSQRAAQTGESPGMFDAIRNKYRQIANKDIQGVMKKNSQSVPMTRANWMNRSTAGMLASNQVKTDAFARLQQANMMADQARAQALNSILGAAGSIAGSYLGREKKETQPTKQGSFAVAENSYSPGRESYGAMPEMGGGGGPY